MLRITPARLLNETHDDLGVISQRSHLSGSSSAEVDEAGDARCGTAIDTDAAPVIGAIAEQAGISQ
jgi:hypothetical protein